MADVRRCLVSASVVTADGGRMLGPGALVDLDASVGGHVILRDCVDAAWFAPVEPQAVEPVRRRPRIADSDRGLGATE